MPSKFQNILLGFLATATTVFGSHQSASAQSKKHKPIDPYTAESKDYVLLRENLTLLGKLDYCDSVAKAEKITHVTAHPRTDQYTAAFFNSDTQTIGLNEITSDGNELTLAYLEELYHAQQHTKLRKIYSDSLQGITKQEYFLFMLVMEADAKAKVAKDIYDADQDNESVQKLKQFYSPYNSASTASNTALYNMYGAEKNEEEKLRFGFLSFFDGRGTTKEGEKEIKQVVKGEIAQPNQVIGKHHSRLYVPGSFEIAQTISKTDKSMGWDTMKTALHEITGPYMKPVIDKANTPEEFIDIITDAQAKPYILDAFQTLGSLQVNTKSTFSEYKPPKL